VIAESKTGPMESKQIYGSMVSVYETGVLLLGESGVGKSETSLELISRGHSLVADDAVVISLLPNSRLSGTAPEMTARILEIRGLGIIDVSEIFGTSAYKKELELSLCAELCSPEEFTASHRLGSGLDFEEMLGVRLPKFVLPVKIGRNIPVLIEAAVKIHLAEKPAGQTATELIDRYDQSLRSHLSQE